MRKVTNILFFVCLLILSACADGPQLAPKNPWYSTIYNLKAKEQLLEKETQQHITDQGLLLYRSYFPWSDEEKYQFSHNIADLPAWQGYLMASYGLKEAETGQDQDDKLLKLAQGMLSYYEVTGVKGLIGRSVFPDYTGPRLRWMADKDTRPTRYWMQGPNGQWWRNGLAKDHLNLTIFGCSIPLYLHRQGKINLNAETEQALIDVMVPAVERLIKNNYYITDFNGKSTEFGNLNPQLLNGFNMLLVLHMLKSASAYSDLAKSEYKQKLPSYASRIKTSFEVLGSFVKNIIGDKRGEWDKPGFSDMQAIGCAYLSLVMQEDKNKEHIKKINRGMSGLWRYMKYERNPMFTFPYVSFANDKYMNRVAEVLEDLHDFPDHKYEPMILGVDTKKIQPLCNRPIDSNYWKSSPFERAAVELTPPQPETEDSVRYASSDYMIAYWLGRYLDFISDSE